MNERFMDLEELDKYGQKLQTYSDYVNDSMNKIAAGFNNLYSEKIIQGRRANVFIEVYKEMDDSRKNVIERLIEIKRFVDNVKTSLANMDKENAQRLKNAIENMGLVQPNSFSKKASTNPLNTNINKEKKESYLMLRLMLINYKQKKNIIQIKLCLIMKVFLLKIYLIKHLKNLIKINIKVLI